MNKMNIQTPYLVMASYLVHGKVRIKTFEKMSYWTARKMAEILKEKQPRYFSVSVVPLW